MSEVLLCLLLISLVAIAIYSKNLYKSLQAAPPFQILSSLEQLSLPKVSVIVPAYNEQSNIENCIQAVLNSTELPVSQLEVWIVDDCSTDDTLAIAESLQQRLKDQRLRLLPGQPRPEGEVWAGKNWACTQAVQKATGDYFLFIDADVRLKPKAIETTVFKAESEQIDLLSVFPAVVCGCLAEWCVQPIMTNNIAVGFDYARVNDDKSQTAFAAGPFMLFRRSAYEFIGGHSAMAAQVLEDVELARAIKKAGLKLKLLPGGDVCSVRMYQSWGTLWEGWTKNLYLASKRNIRTMLYFALIMLVVYVMPWLAFFGLLFKYALSAWQSWDYLALILAIVAIASHYYIRLLSSKHLNLSTSYWWLGGIGGTVIALAAIASIIKTETGWGWTWRGRQLSVISNQ